MRRLREGLIERALAAFAPAAVEAHLFGSVARGEDDALSDVDIWFTFEDGNIEKAVAGRMEAYARLGEIILLHEMQNNFPLGGIQTAIIYKIEGELVRVDFYLCPLSSARVLPGSKVLFAEREVPVGEIVPETKRTPRDLSDRITFFISMCFNGVKKAARGDVGFAAFLAGEFAKHQGELPALAAVRMDASFGALRSALAELELVSDATQRRAVGEVRAFAAKIEVGAS